MISVLIPFSPDGGHRDRVFSWISRRWAALLPEAQVCIGQSEEPFNRAVARNLAYQQSLGDILVVADADTMVRYRPLRVALDIVQELQERDSLTRTWVLPYATYYNLTELSTAELLTRPPDVNPLDPTTWDHKLATSESGIIVMPREAWEAVGGYDEQFVGWGYEDNAMALALDTLWGERTRLAASVFHLWHEVADNGAFNSPMIEQNRSRYRRYQRAAGRPEAMAALCGAGSRA